MNYTEQLKDEHQGIILMLRILDKMCDMLDAGEPVDTDHLERSVEFLKVFADTCHHAKEEEILFPAMERAGIPKEGGPIGVMLREHETGRNYVRGLSKAVTDYASGKSDAARTIVENARNYIALLAQHITKEDTILYPLADAHIPRNVQNDLLEKFNAIETERIGPGRHEELHELLKQLEAAYLYSEQK